MPAPAVIPAPIAYIKVVAVKTLVVGFQGPVVRWSAGDSVHCADHPFTCERGGSGLNWSGFVSRILYHEQIRVLQAGHCGWDSLAWDNETGRPPVRWLASWRNDQQELSGTFILLGEG